jgi:hypothetical protein
MVRYLTMFTYQIWKGHLNAQLTTQGLLAPPHPNARY